MMEECNYLINPFHVLFDKVKILSEKPVRIDNRIFKPVA